MLQSPGIVFEQLLRELILILSLVTNLLSYFNFRVTPHTTQRRLRIPCQTVQLIPETLDIVHRVQYDDALPVNILLY